MKTKRNYSKEFEAISNAYEKAGGDVSNLLTKDIVSIIVSGNEVIGRNTVEGVNIEAEKDENYVHLTLNVEDNVKLKKPVHLCVGYLKKFGEQYLDYDINIGNNCKVNFVSHCSFPTSQKILHKMTANINIGKDSTVNYQDSHFHNDNGFVDLQTFYYVNVGKNSKFDNRFELTKTRVGKMKVLMDVSLEENAKTYVETKVKEKMDDVVNINEIIRLNGKNSSGIAKTYVVGKDSSIGEVINEAYGIGDYSKGHIECEEIIAGENVELSTIPKLKVKNPKSEITHEASVGKINSEQLETLMSKGLTEEEASELIINGIFS